MTWREVCAFLTALGIPVSRSPPTLLHALREGHVYQELIHRISPAYYVRHRVGHVHEVGLAPYDADAYDAYDDDGGVSGMVSAAALLPYDAAVTALDYTGAAASIAADENQAPEQGLVASAAPGPDGESERVVEAMDSPKRGWGLKRGLEAIRSERT